MRIQIGAGGVSQDWCHPHPENKAAVFQSSEGLGFNPEPERLVRPIPKVICIFPGVQPAELINWMENRGADVSWFYELPGYFVRTDQLQQAVNLTEINLAQNRYVVAPIDPNYRSVLEAKGIEYAVVHPDRKMKQAWLRMMRKMPGNSASDLKVFFDNWDRSIKELESVSTHQKAQRYRLVIKDKALFVQDVPEYLRPESDRVRMYLASYHDAYAFDENGDIADGKEPIYQINDQVYGRVKEHTIKLQDVT
jgi:hypothetical protein